jgi:hypothetical protein
MQLTTSPFLSLSGKTDNHHVGCLLVLLEPVHFWYIHKWAGVLEGIFL